MKMLNSAVTENDLKIVFEKAGISNSQAVINILKNIVATQQEFIFANPDFYDFTIEKQTEILNASVELYKKKYVKSNVPVIPPDGLVGKNCAETFNKTIDRCSGDFGTCAVFAVAGAYAGIVPGLLGAAYCMSTKVTCDRRAKDDYKECLTEQVFPDGPPPVTGQLTIRCDKFIDTCWTVDSNGKYVGPYKP